MCEVNAGPVLLPQHWLLPGAGRQVWGGVRMPWASGDQLGERDPRGSGGSGLELNLLSSAVQDLTTPRPASARGAWGSLRHETA